MSDQNQLQPQQPLPINITDYEIAHRTTFKGATIREEKEREETLKSFSNKATQFGIARQKRREDHSQFIREGHRVWVCPTEEGREGTLADLWDKATRFGIA